MPIDITSVRSHANAEQRRRTWTAAYRDLKQMKLDEYTTEMSLEQYAMKGVQARWLQSTVGNSLGLRRVPEVRAFRKTRSRDARRA